MEAATQPYPTCSKCARRVGSALSYVMWGDGTYECVDCVGSDSLRGWLEDEKPLDPNPD